MVTMFIDILPSPYYDKVVGNVASNFVDHMMVGERIELGIRWGKFSQTNSRAGFIKKPIFEKKKGEINAVLVEPIFPQGKANILSYPTQIHIGPKLAVAYTNQPTSNRQYKASATRYKKATQDIDPDSHALYKVKPLQPPYPRSYDPTLGVTTTATERCWSLKHKVQDLLDGGLLGFPSRPVYNNNAIPWRYPTTTPPTTQEDPTPKVTNIAGAREVTESKRNFALEGLQGKNLTLEKKGKAVEAPKIVVIKEEAIEFLKLICHNTHVAQDIMLEKFEGIISNITTSRHLSFSEDEVLAKGRSHNQPLHIAVKCDNYMIARMLIDNVSSLNVMPKATLDKLYCSSATLKNRPVMVRAFGRSK
ncbi:hypothetical protein CR513_33670, partial [Mucuna pruriens]